MPSKFSKCSLGNEIGRELLQKLHLLVVMLQLQGAVLRTLQYTIHSRNKKFHGRYISILAKFCGFGT